MRGFIKTLFGDARTVSVAVLCIGVTMLMMHSPLAPFSGAILPAGLLAGSAYLAKH